MHASTPSHSVQLQQTERAALQLLRNFLQPLFLLCSCLAVPNVCVCVCVCVWVGVGGWVGVRWLVGVLGGGTLCWWGLPDALPLLFDLNPKAVFAVSTASCKAPQKSRTNIELWQEVGLHSVRLRTSAGCASANASQHRESSRAIMREAAAHKAVVQCLSASTWGDRWCLLLCAVQQ